MSHFDLPTSRLQTPTNFIHDIERSPFQRFIYQNQSTRMKITFFIKQYLTHNFYIFEPNRTSVKIILSQARFPVSYTHLVCSVSGIYHRMNRNFTGISSSPFYRMPHHDQVSIIIYHLDRILQSLSLGDTRRRSICKTDNTPRCV